MPLFDGQQEQFEKRSPIGQWQVVTVTFTQADTDVVVAHQLPTPLPEQIDYEVLRSNGPVVIYHDGSPSRRKWGPGFVVLRANTATVTADIRLTVSAEPVFTRALPAGIFTTPAVNADTLDGLDSTAFAQDAFKTISSPSETDIVAAGPTDTLTIEGGSGIDIGLNAGAKKVTISTTVADITELDDVPDVTAPSPSDGDVLTWDAGSSKWVNDTPAAASANTLIRTIGITIDGGGSAITTGLKGFIQVPYSGTIASWTLLSTDAAGPATSGSIVIDIWKDTYANYPPTVADTITASAKPTLSSASKNTSSTLTGWTTSITAGDVLGFNVDSATTVTRVALELKVTVV